MRDMTMFDDLLNIILFLHERIFFFPGYAQISETDVVISKSAIKKSCDNITAMKEPSLSSVFLLVNEIFFKNFQLLQFIYYPRKQDGNK